MLTDHLYLHPTKNNLPIRNIRGPEYYEWVGYSWWGGDKDGQSALDFARKVNKPVFIAEATPRGHFFDKEDPDEVWKKWFEKFFAHMEKNIDVVRATSYINAFI